MSSKQFFETIIQRPWLTISLTLVMIFSAAWGGQYLELKTDYREFFSEDSIYLKSFELLEDTYSKSDTVIFIVDPADDDVFSEESLKLLLRLTDLSWQLPYSQRVDSITNFQHILADAEGLSVRDLVASDLPLTEKNRAFIKKAAIEEDVLRNKLVSENGRVAAVAVNFSMPGIEQVEIENIVFATRALKREISQQFPGSNIYITGMIMANYAGVEVIGEEAVTLIPMMFVVIIGLLYLLFRSLVATATILCVIIFSLLGTLGLAGWVGMDITSPVASAPVIILTMAIADSVHILVTYNHNLNNGFAKNDALLDSLSVNLRPVFLTSLTTAIGFLSMNFSDSPPFRVLGDVVAVGVFMAFVLSLTFLPALLSVISTNTAKVGEEQQSHWIEPFATWILRQRTVIFWGIGGLTIVLLSFISQNEINDQFAKYFDKSREFRYASDFADEHLTGMYGIQYSLESPYDGGIYNPEFLRQTEKFSQWLKSLPDVNQVNSVTDIFKNLNKNMHGGDEAWHKIPEDQALAAQYFLLYELSLPFGLDVTNMVNFDKTSTRLFISLKEQKTQQMLTNEKKINHWLDTNLPEIKYYQGSVTQMFSHLSVDNATSMIKGTTFALVLISIIITFALGSIKIGMVSFFSNLMPAALAFGVWGILFAEVGMSIAISIGMTLGIVVDNTVHFLSKYLHARKEKLLSPEEAIHYAFTYVGVALLICNFVLMAGFLVLGMSDFKLNSDMGIFTALTLLLALVIDLIFLPTLLLRIDKEKPVPVV